MQSSNPQSPSLAPVQDLPTETLAVMAGRGDTAAFGELYERHADQVYRIVATRMHGDQAAAEDVTAETWIKAMRHLPHWEPRGEGSFTAWLHTIARRTTTDHLRRAWQWREVLQPDMLALDHPAGEIGPQEFTEQRERARQVAHAVRRLSLTQQQCVMLRFHHGMSVAETAQIMDRTAESVRVLQCRALRKLRAILPEIENTPTLIAVTPAATALPRSA